MRATEFKQQLERLERLYNKGKPLDDPLRDEYFQVFKYFSTLQLAQGIDELVKTHKPDYGHVFPSPSVILDAINDTLKQGSAATPDELRSYCEKCQDQGWVLTAGPPGHSFPGSATPCSCPIGQKVKDRSRRESRRFWPHGYKLPPKPNWGEETKKDEGLKQLPHLNNKDQPEDQEDEELPF